MTTASAGNEIALHYTGTLEDGTEFDSSEGRDPLTFTMGQGEIIPGLEEGLAGMSVGEKKSITVKAENAYGPRHPEAVQTVPRDALPEDMEPAVGMRLQAQQEDGKQLMLTVAEVSETQIKLDANHPLAGEDLTFAVEIVDIK